VVCYYCGKPGHIAKECRKKKFDAMHNRLHGKGEDQGKGESRQGPTPK